MTEPHSPDGHSPDTHSPYTNSPESQGPTAHEPAAAHTGRDPQTVPPRSAGRRPRSRRGLLFGGLGLLVLLVVVALVLLFTVGPFSSESREEDDVADAVTGLGSSTTFADFNSRICQQYRLPKEMVDAIAASGAQTGTDVDTMFREQAMSHWPKDLTVDDVHVDGDSATADTTAKADGQTKSEQIHLRREEDKWRICEPGVGMGSVPPQPGK